MASRSGQSEYGCSVMELRNLMEYRGHETKEKIQAEYGGTEGLCERLKTDLLNGVPNNKEELERRRAVFGTNELPPHLVSLSPIEWELKFSVIRGGYPIEVMVKELVVGDIVEIQYGDLIPADGIMVASNDLMIDESLLTGDEEDLSMKSLDWDPVLLSGTLVMEGRGKMLVTAVGVNVYTGIIMTLLGASNTATEEEQESAKREDSQPLPTAYQPTTAGCCT